MKNDGTNTATTESIASNRGMTTSRLASSTPRATGAPRARCVWMFSIATVASSTRMPTASASPPSVMMLIVWPAPHSATTAVSSANGIVTTTMAELRQSRRNSSTIRPVSSAPSAASRSTAWSAARHVAGLIELVADLDVVGHQRLEPSEVRLHLADDASAWRRRGASSRECRRRAGR